VTDDQDAYRLAITPTARRQLPDHLPETVAAAAYGSSSARCWTAPTAWASGSAHR
jgi:hypothetical protein